MGEINVFNKSIRGSSHLASDKPCQDYSISYNEKGVQILVVCDGHGGESYFRSDIGARLAAEKTVETLIDFSNQIGSNPFANCSFSITSKPNNNPFKDSEGNTLRYEDMNENKKSYARQAKSYTEASSKYIDKQNILNELLKNIYIKWKIEISHHKDENPFSAIEQIKLNGKNIEKAYGCTLLAYMQTESYWLSFQIGDGKVLFCNKDLSWSSPIQEDCNCFLNYTTSLCDSNPLDEFRYAFSGEGIFPFSIFLCSDGIEGSLRTEVNIKDFYEQIIEVCVDGEDVNSELEDYLPKLSEIGNKDDLSISGVVYLNRINSEEFSKRLGLQRKKRTIQNEQNSKKAELDKLSSSIETHKDKLVKYHENRTSLKNALNENKRLRQNMESEFTDNERNIHSIQGKINALHEELKVKEKDYDDWSFTVKNDLASIEEEMDKLIL